MDNCKWIENDHISRDMILESIPAPLRPVVGGWFIYPNANVCRVDIAHTIITKPSSGTSSLPTQGYVRLVERYAHQTNPSLFEAISTYLSNKLLAGGGDAEPQTASAAGKFAKHSRYTVFNSQVFVAPSQLPSLGHTIFNILPS